MIRRKKIPFDELFRGRPALKKYLRRAPNGCLIYHGPMKGRTPGNPLVGLGGGKSTISLRTWIWERHNGKRPARVFIWMTCGNGMCFEYDHMDPRRGERPCYGPKRSEYIVRFTPLQIRTALYFRGKLSQSVLSGLLGMRPDVVLGIWKKSAVHTRIETPKGWHPDKVVIRRAEVEAISQRKIYLGPDSMREARTDIERSSVEAKRKQLAIRFIQGETSKAIHSDYGFTQGGVMYVYRQTLAIVYRELGYRPWMRLASKGIISR